MSEAFSVEFQERLNALRCKKIELTEIEDDRQTAGEVTARVFRQVVDVGGVEFPGNRDYRGAGVELSSNSRAAGGETVEPTAVPFGGQIHVVNNSH